MWWCWCVTCVRKVSAVAMHADIGQLCRLTRRKWCNRLCVVSKQSECCDPNGEATPPSLSHHRSRTEAPPLPLRSGTRSAQTLLRWWLFFNLKGFKKEKKRQTYFELRSFSIKVLNQVFFVFVWCLYSFFLEHVSRLLPNCGLHTYSILLPLPPTHTLVNHV